MKYLTFFQKNSHLPALSVKTQNNQRVFYSERKRIKLLSSQDKDASYAAAKVQL
jgi:hypothetical protein